MKQAVAAVPPAGSISQEEMYHRILAAAKAAKVYGSAAEDVAAEAWIIAQQRGYFESRILREAARNLGLWRVAREVDIDDLAGDGIYSTSLSAWRDEQRRENQHDRIRHALHSAPSPVRQAAELVLQGYTMYDAAAMCGMSASAFSVSLKSTGEAIGERKNPRPKQLALFAAEVAA